MKKRPRLQKITIAQLFQKRAKQYSKRNALLDDERTLTYGRLDELTGQIAKGILESGIKHGDLCGIFCRTSVDTIVTFYAILKAGARVLMLPEKVTEADLVNYLEVDGLDTLFCDTVHYEQFGQSAYLKQIRNRFLVDAGSKDGWSGLDRLLEAGRKSDIDIGKLIAEKDCFETEVMLFTSGTTGRPKIVMSSGYSRANGGLQQSYDQHMTCRDVVMEALPVHHCFAMQVNVLSALAAGASVFVPKDRHTATVIDGIRKHGCTVLSAVPSLYSAIIKNPMFSENEIRLRTGIIGGGTYTPKMFCEIERDFAPSFTLLSSLGMTEGTAGVTVCEMDDPLSLRSETLGHFMAYVEGKILDPKNGNECAPGKEGEICFRGYNVMQGYYHNPEATRAAIDENGFLHSGDLGFVDERNYLHITGRIKDIIIRAGENIAPAEIEKVLLDDPRIDSCKVVGVRDDHYGELVYAVVVPKEKITEDDVKNTVASKLIKCKVPSGVVFIDALPLSGNGKINTIECRRLAQEKADNL